MTPEIIKDLEYQKELLLKEKRRLANKIKVTEIELGQLRLRRVIVDYSIESIDKELNPLGVKS